MRRRFDASSDLPSNFEAYEAIAQIVAGDEGVGHTRIKPSIKSPKSRILVTEVITFDRDNSALGVILGRF